MNGKAVLLVLLSPVLILCLTSALSIIKCSIQKPRICVDPKDNEFLTRTTPLGSNFTVSVKSADWTSPGVYGYQLTLYYNNTLLEAIDAEFPKNHWLEPSTPIVYFDGPPRPEIHQEQGFVSAAFALLGNEVGRTGNGTLCTATFRIIQTPPKGENFSCTLGLENVTMVNPDAELIPPEQYDIVDGKYSISAADPMIKEDLNRDGRVNILDLAIVAFSFRSLSGDAGWNAKADLNGDGEVDIVDLTQIAKAWTW